MMLTKPLKKSDISYKQFIYGLFVALSVFVLGFGCMNLYWLFHKNTHNLPGLYDYYAATFGDGLLLPIMMGSGTVYLYRNKKLWDLKICRLSNLIGVIFAIIAFAIQISWLANPNIGLNWTIPTPHYFNIAGWHHCFFFVFVFYLVGSVSSRILLMKRKLKELDTISCVMYAFYWASGIAFVFLYLIDDYSEKCNYVKMLVIALVVLLSIIGILNKLFSKKVWTNDFLCVVALSIIYLGVIIIMNNGISNIILSIIAIMISFMCINPKGIKPVVKTYLLIGLPTAILTIVALFVEKGIYQYVIGVIAIFYPLIVSEIYKETKKINWEIAIYGSSMIFVLLCVKIFDNFLFSIVIGFATGTIANYYIRKIFTIVIENEESMKSNATAADKEKSIKIKGCTYAYIANVVIIALYLIVLQVSNMIDIKLQISHIYNWNFLNIGVLLLSFGIFSLTFFVQSIENNTVKIIGVIAALLSYLGIISVMLSLIPLPLFVGVKVYGLYVFALPMMIFIPILIAEGFYSNIIAIQDGDVLWYHKTVIGLIFMGCITVTFLTAYLLIVCRNFSVCSIILSILAIIFSYIVTPYLIGRITRCEKKKKLNKTISDTGGVLQDGFLWSILCILLHIVYVISIQSGRINGPSLATLVSTIIWPIGFCLKNNVNHIKQENKLSLSRKQWNALRYHLRCQNIFCLAAIFPFSLLILVFNLMDYIRKAKTQPLGMEEVIKKDFWPQ